MRAKLIKEEIENILTGKSEEEVRRIIEETGQAPAVYIAKLLNDEKGQKFKANFDGAWDRNGPIEHVEVTQINRGKGFEDAVLVKSPEGTFVYIGPFRISNYPTSESMFLFYADEGLFINEIDFSKL